MKSQESRDKSQKPLVIGHWSLVILPLLLLAGGCVQVSTSVKGSGKVTKELVLVVPKTDAEGMKRLLQNRLKGWKVWVERGEGDRIEVHARYNFNAQRETRPVPGLQVEFERRLRWFPPVANYRYREVFEPARFFKERQEQIYLQVTPVQVSVRMPGFLVGGIIAEETSTGVQINGRLARWEWKDGLKESQVQIETASWTVRWFWLLLYVFVLWALVRGGQRFYPSLREMMPRLKARLKLPALRRRKRA